MNTFGSSAFISKASYYSKGRPKYSDDAIDYVIRQFGLNREMSVADVGAGTGILTSQLTIRFREVIAIEPNDEMRAQIGSKAIRGTAESTGLKDASIDAVFAAQAFHWFKPVLARSELKRVLRGNQVVILLWNDRQVVTGTGMEPLDALMTRLRGRSDQVLEADEQAIAEFFDGNSFEKAEFENPHYLDRESLLSMVLSRSYAPKVGTNEHDLVIQELDNIFKRFSKNDRFCQQYSTAIYYGCLK